jgi:hypothetical protein
LGLFHQSKYLNLTLWSGVPVQEVPGSWHAGGERERRPKNMWIWWIRIRIRIWIRNRIQNRIRNTSVTEKEYILGSVLANWTASLFPPGIDEKLREKARLQPFWLFVAGSCH